MNDLLNKALVLAVIALAGCGRGLPRPEAPKPRTVSFSPAITEMMFEMGLGDHVVGVTKYCKPPDGLGIRIVGDDVNITVEPILAVKPDLLITQSDPSRFQTLGKLDPKIRIEYISIETFSDIAEAMLKIATLMKDPGKGQTARTAFLKKLDEVRTRVSGRPRPRVIFVMGHHSPSTAGQGTFINELIEVAGGVNAAGEKYKGWKSIDIESLLKLEPDVIVCESKSPVADEARQYWTRLTVDSAKEVRVHVVVDRRWTIPTGRMADTFAPLMADFIHPETARGSER